MENEAYLAGRRNKPAGMGISSSRSGGAMQRCVPLVDAMSRNWLVKYTADIFAFQAKQKAFCCRRRDRSRACASTVREFRFQCFYCRPAGGSGWRSRRHAITNSARPFGSAHGPMGRRFRGGRANPHADFRPLFSLFKQSKKAICYRRRDRSRACASAVRGFRFQSFRSHPAGGSGWRRRRHAITNPARPFGSAHGPMGQRFRERESVNKRTGPGMGRDGFRCMVWTRRSAVSAGWEICKQLHKQEKNA